MSLHLSFLFGGMEFLAAPEKCKGVFIFGFVDPSPLSFKKWKIGIEIWIAGAILFFFKLKNIVWYLGFVDPFL